MQFSNTETTSRLSSKSCQSSKGVRSVSRRRGTGRWISMAVLAIALFFGSMAINIAPVHAAATPEAEAYDPGPVRQTRNPITGENFDGGVDRSALDEDVNRRIANDEEEGPIESFVDRLRGDNGAETSSANPGTQKNPTLKRYTNVQ
ncbi:hypothetical protein [Oscillatoria sp. CS-180]|uniref:hypothetical protein n=1 Tax=Oscillatoria sp. CS-180 TaxID=3021720 RepID=UPI00232D0E27|nr:hypothetical protein [Oscillatoria sp. CS-180]